jgi:FixJ family two-component response regulator
MECTETIVYVASNEAAERERLRSFCVSNGFGIHAFSSAHDFVKIARDERAACLILDLNHADASTPKLQSELHHIGSPPVIFLTSSSDLVTVVQTIHNGAIDFFLKPVDHQHLRAAIEVAFEKDRKQRSEGVELKSLLTRWNSLTPRETEVLQLTVAGLLNKQGAAELGVAENTYQVHRGRVMKKMDAGSLADLVRMSTKIEPILGTLRREGHDMQALQSIIGKPIAKRSALLRLSSDSKWALNVQRASSLIGGTV